MTDVEAGTALAAPMVTVDAELGVPVQAPLLKKA